MVHVTRRRLLRTVGVSLSLALAGCSEDADEEPGLHAINTLVLHRRGDAWYDYPEDVGVRVTIENTDVDRHQGVVTVTLRSATGEGEWTRERDIDLAGGTSVSLTIAFADVAESGDAEFEATAAVRATEA
jgi:hypothetical protein